MAVCNIDERWSTLSGISHDRYWNHLSKINDHEFILVHSGFDDGDGVYKYNVHKNEWSQMIIYPKHKIHIETVSISQEKHKTKIYLGDWENQNLIMFNMENQQLSTKKRDYSVVEASSMVVVNDVFHNIGGNEYTKHTAWNSHNDETVVMHDFTENGIDEVWCPSAIYVPSKQMILLIGGKDYENHKMIGIWKFCLITKKWQKLEELKID